MTRWKSFVETDVAALQVMKAENDGSSTQYLVHYAGWNVRYDEWVSKDRVMSVVELGKPGYIDRQSSRTANAAPPKPKVCVLVVFRAEFFRWHLKSLQGQKNGK